ncbi:MAG: carboxypeptidase regulatory-like domain-containing protein [Chloroflexaceae bacterium]|nr:carboxypeptidase regulatory-like domain-containing protein [Chloroflexaceae bacterium]
MNDESITSTSSNIADGELLAYLDGTGSPATAAALAQSPALQARLAALQAADAHFERLFGGILVPDPQDLVDVATGHATPNQQLRVAAYLRDYAPARAAFAELVVAEQPRRRILPLIGILALASGTVRSTSSAGQLYYVSEVNAQVTVRVIPPDDELWAIEGRITQDDQPLGGVRVRVRPLNPPDGNPRARTRTTDTQGFFRFAKLTAPMYHLEATLDYGTILIPAIANTG